MIDHALSAKLRKRINALPRRCFTNALAAMPHAPPGTVYVRGVLGPPSRCVEAVMFESGGLGTVECEPVGHAWLEAPNGDILEVTPLEVTMPAEWYCAEDRYGDYATAWSWLRRLDEHVRRQPRKRYPASLAHLVEVLRSIPRDPWTGDWRT